MKFPALLSLVLLTAFATGLASQVNVTTGARTIPSGNHMAQWHFDVDFGATPQNVSLTATLESSTNAGIEIELWMIDMITGSASVLQALDHRMILGFPVSGTASSVIWGTGAPDGFPAGPFSMSGVHRFQFTVSGANAGGAYPANLIAGFETNTGTLIPPTGTNPPGSVGVTQHQWSQSAGTTPGMTPGSSLVGSTDCYQRNLSNTAWCLVRFGDGNDEPVFFIDVAQDTEDVDVSMRVLALGSSGSGGSGDVTAELYNLTQGWDRPIVSAGAKTSNPGNLNAGFGTNLGVRNPVLTRYRLVLTAQNMMASPGNFADFLVEICFGSNALLLDVAREPEQASPRMEITPASMQLSTSTALTVTGGTNPPDYNWALETPVPQGVSLSANTGAGVTLQVDGSAPPDFTVTVRCANGQTGELVRQVYGPVQVLRPASLPAGIEGVPWPGRTFEGAGGETPYSWSATGLPPGLTLDSGTGQLSGTPTASGDFAAEIFIADNASVIASRNYTISIGAAPPLAIAPDSLPDGMVGTDYSVLIGAAGGVAPFSWSLNAGSLPPGLSMGTSTTGTVEISGMPGANGSFSFTVRLEDGTANAVTRDYTLVISRRPTSGSSSSSGGTCAAGGGALPLSLLLLLFAALGAALCTPTRSRRLRSMRG